MSGTCAEAESWALPRRLTWTRQVSARACRPRACKHTPSHWCPPPPPLLTGNEHISALDWLPGGRLVVGTASGQLVGFHMLPGEVVHEDLPAELAAVQLDEAAAPPPAATDGTPPADSTPAAAPARVASPEPVPPPPTPPSEPPRSDVGATESAPAVAAQRQQQEAVSQRYARASSAELPAGTPPLPDRQRPVEQLQYHNHMEHGRMGSSSLEDASPTARGKAMAQVRGQGHSVSESRAGSRGGVARLAANQLIVCHRARFCCRVHGGAAVAADCHAAVPRGLAAPMLAGNGGRPRCPPALPSPAA